MPSLQQIRYLVALADTLHFRRAAEACHVTQPTLSAQVRALELRLGAQLVERGRGRVILTPVGAAVVERGRRVLREVEEIRGLARSGPSALEGSIRMGILPTLGSYLLPLIVPDLREAHPRLAVVIREEMPPALLRGLDEGALDLLMLPLPHGRRDLAAQPVFREPLLAVVPEGHRLAARPEVAPGMLGGETVLAPGPGHPLHEQVRAICEAEGARLLAPYEGANLDALRQMVRMGMGLSIMPALYVRSEVAPRDGVLALPFGARAPSRDIGLLWRRHAPRRKEYDLLAAFLRDVVPRRMPEVARLGPGSLAVAAP